MKPTLELIMKTAGGVLGKRKSKNKVVEDIGYDIKNKKSKNIKKV